MSNAQISTASSKDVFTPPAYEQPHIYRQIQEIIGDVTEVVSKVWPLRDYVAINPYGGIAGRSFTDARSFLRIFSDCELLMPMEYYRSRHLQGELNAQHVRVALDETASAGIDSGLSVQEVMNQLQRGPGNEDLQPVQAKSASKRAIRTIAEYADDFSEQGWSEAITDEVGKFCASHYDQMQSTWTSPWKDLPVFQAWKSAAKHDRNPEILGLTGFREFVATIPETPEAAIIALLSRLQIPVPLWESFLLCQVFSLPGWFAWTKYHDCIDDQVEGQDLVGLLAVRLAYDVALSEVTGLSVKWEAMIDQRSATFRPLETGVEDDSPVRKVLLRAMEISYRDGILNQLVTDAPATSGRKLAQMVFCIDVRSERFRRQLESLTPEIETFGFAGFFGMPLEYVKLGEQHGDGNVPALIKPHFKAYEGFVGEDAEQEASMVQSRRRNGLWFTLWKTFQKSAVGCFSFVETTGLLYGAKLFRNTRVKSPLEISSAGGATRKGPAMTGPTLRGLNRQGWTTSDQADLAESMLRNLGLVDGFARLVVLCGHASQTTNNPLAAGLDCGACGGHSGEPNARFAALLLNQPFIREVLAEREIVIPDDTVFLAGLHNTTTDGLTLFDRQQIPSSHERDLQELLDYTHIASAKTRKERAPLVGSKSASDVLRRAMDWSEVRPEWGLAGNAAFFVGPRWMTKNMNLDGRMFLHSYEHQSDHDGSVLENIMTAPMVVAHWINMQYYASTVDNRHFGSGDKTVHNVVGGLGVVSGNGGDLMTGLPTQSLHDGKEFRHSPMRLQVLIAASRSSIVGVIDKHPHIKDLVDNDWLHLIAIEDGQFYRYAEQGWTVIDREEAHAQLQG